MSVDNQELKIELKTKKSKVAVIYENVVDGIYRLFDKILEDPVENFFYECISIILGYFQLIIYIIDETVNYLYNFI